MCVPFYLLQYGAAQKHYAELKNRDLSKLSNFNIQYELGLQMEVKHLTFVAKTILVFIWFIWCFVMLRASEHAFQKHKILSIY